jgi:hypothetical protein
MTRRQALRLLALGSLLTLLGVGLARPSVRPASAATLSDTGRYCGEQRLFGYVRSLTKNGKHYLLRFDPAFFLSGKTANQAAAQDGAVPKGQPVPNDNYVVNESRRTYVYTLTRATRIQVLLKGGNITEGSPVSAVTLAQLVRGRHPVKLFEGLESGFWLGVHIDQACSLSQQYHP